jgi:hypothetical protein
LGNFNAASRSVALPLAVIYAMVRRSYGGTASLAVAITLVQLFDGIVGFRLNDPSRAYGPLVFAAINLRRTFVDEPHRNDPNRTLEKRMCHKNEEANHSKNRNAENPCYEASRPSFLTRFGSRNANTPNKSFAYQIA